MKLTVLSKGEESSALVQGNAEVDRKREWEMYLNCHDWVKEERHRSILLGPKLQKTPT